MLDVIQSNPNILGGTPVFKGTRVPVEVFFDHIESGVTIEEFIQDFSTVTKEQCIQILELAEHLLTSNNLKQLYESADR
jgi:uncharacterized protein (DUF433 family)